MPNVNIQLPTMNAEHSIEITVKINEQQRNYNFRVEIFPWEDCSDSNNKIQCLTKIIKNYDQKWQLIQIGDSTEKDIALMFKQIASYPA